MGTQPERTDWCTECVVPILVQLLGYTGVPMRYRTYQACAEWCIKHFSNSDMQDFWVGNGHDRIVVLEYQQLSDATKVRADT